MQMPPGGYRWPSQRSEEATGQRIEQQEGMPHMLWRHEEEEMRQVANMAGQEGGWQVMKT